MPNPVSTSYPDYSPYCEEGSTNIGEKVCVDYFDWPLHWKTYVEGTSPTGGTINADDATAENFPGEFGYGRWNEAYQMFFRRKADVARAYQPSYTQSDGGNRWISLRDLGYDSMADFVDATENDEAFNGGCIQDTEYDKCISPNSWSC